MAMKSQGAVVEVNDGSTWLVIGEITSVEGPSGEAEEIDVTHLGSSAKEYMVGLPDEGSLTLQGNYNPSDAGQSQCWADRASQTKRQFRVTYTDSGPTVASFEAYVKSFSTSLGVGNKISVSIGLRISGAVSLA